MNWRSGRRKINRQIADVQRIQDYMDTVDAFVLEIQTATKSMVQSLGLIGEAVTAVSASVGRIEPRAAKPPFPVTPTEMK